MRVLILLIAVAGCFEPSVDDCQFTCGDDDACPSGTTCINNVCRTRSTGTCAAGADAAEVCPGAPPSPAGCSPRFALENGGCGVVCSATPRSWNDAASACTPSWRLAILDSDSKLAAVPATPDQYWVGARRATTTSTWLWGNGTAVADSAWDNGTPAPLSGEDCALLDRPKGRLVNDAACADSERFLCTYP